MSTKDTSEDYYGHRLVEVNKSNPVVANENIYNQQGVVLLAKGKSFSGSRADVIAKHKLVKPLEHSVDISVSLDAKELYDLLIKFTKTLPGLNVLTGDKEIQDLIQQGCKYYQKFPLLRQKLTVLANQLPEVYFNSLYSAVAGVILAKELQLKEQQCRNIFIAGLMHNIGFLHLNPELTRDESDLEKNESLLVQVHPIIAKHFLDQVPKLPKEIGDIVENHHERTDGTGYPKSKFGINLSIESQVIAFTDTTVNAYRQCQEQGEHAHQLMVLILQFNTNIHFETVYKAAAKLMRLGPCPNTAPPKPPKARTLLDQQLCIYKTLEACKKLALVLMKNTHCRLTKSIASMLGRLATSVISAGITQEEYRLWLEELHKHDDPNEHLNMLKSKVMQDEIENQLERLKSIMWKTIRKIPSENEALIQSTTLSYEQILNLKHKYHQ